MRLIILKKTIEKSLKLRIDKNLPSSCFKSFTSDRGKDFECYIQVENELGIDFYFSEPYSAWQRGTNENSNELLREFYPKKTDQDLVDEEDLIESLKKINARPRKYLAFDIAFDRFLYELNCLN